MVDQIMVIQTFSCPVGYSFLVLYVYSGLVGGIVWTAKEQED